MATRPPLSAALLMADDWRQSQPEAAHLQPLWTQLRMLTFAALHSACTQRRQGIPTTVTSVAAWLVHQLRAGMPRSDSMNSSAALADVVQCSTWLRVSQPFIILTNFQLHWGQPGAPYQVTMTCCMDQGVCVE